MDQPKHPWTVEQLEEERALLEKVRKLIALSASSHEEEGRTAAMMACRLIREHQFLIAPLHAEKALKEHGENNERLIRGIEACMKKKKAAAR